MRIKAPCKINLGLDVLRRRTDGYHDLSTVMIPVEELHDIIEVVPIEGALNEFHSLGIKVDCPDAKSSDAPTRVNTLSTIPTRASLAGTKEPICAITVIIAT